MASNQGIAKREQLKAKIIQGAIDALAESGPAAVTTRKIAAKAGVNLATLHYYFESKDALLIGALEAIIAQMSQAFKIGLAEQPDFSGCIESVIRNSWNLIKATRNIQILQYELTLYTLRNEETKSLAKLQYDSYCRLYEDSFRQCLHDVKVALTIDLAELARFVVAGMDGLIIQYLADPDDERANRGLQNLIAATLALIAARVQI
ncbi:TetR family transcriptional regulator [Burkholderia sp. 4701]|nr:TetR family transcriptional regulator [Burkholderia sp. 4701]MXN83285.1 TetR family transcriptional regulator [Burkholderia sp. 4812]